MPLWNDDIGFHCNSCSSCPFCPTFKVIPRMVKIKYVEISWIKTREFSKKYEGRIFHIDKKSCKWMNADSRELHLVEFPKLNLGSCCMVPYEPPRLLILEL